MQDQVGNYSRWAFPPACLNAATLPDERAHILQQAAPANTSFSICSGAHRPLATRWTAEALPISFFAIDEAIAFRVGHEFRPEYRQLSRLREIFPAG